MKSKLGLHISGFPDPKLYDQVGQAQPRLLKLFDIPSPDKLDELRRRAPGALIVYRPFSARSNDYRVAPEVFVAEMNEALSKLAGRGLVWEGLNEPVINTPDEARQLSAWFVRFAQLIHARGERCAVFSFSTGNPNLALVPYLVDAARACDFIALHEYAASPTDLSMIGRFRAFLDALPLDARKPVVITETGLDDGRGAGWQKYLSPDAYLAQLSKIDAIYCSDPWLVGAAIFQYGAGGLWQTFEINSLAASLAAYIQSADVQPAVTVPPPPPPVPGGPVVGVDVSGWCPFAVKRPLAHPNFWNGRAGHAVRAVVEHIAAGSGSLFNWFSREGPSASSAHFWLSRSGGIEQYVSIDDSAWACGYVNRPTWSGLLANVNPNLYTINVEHEGQPEDLRSSAMVDADVRLLKWIAGATGLVFRPHETLIGHGEIDGVNRPNDPGPHFDFQALADAANGERPPAANLPAALRAAARRVPWLALNPDAALYRYAAQHGLGSAQTDEFPVDAGGETYLAQVYERGLVYALLGDWGHVSHIAKE